MIPIENKAQGKILDNPNEKLDDINQKLAKNKGKFSADYANKYITTEKSSWFDTFSKRLVTLFKEGVWVDNTRMQNRIVRQVDWLIGKLKLTDLSPDEVNDITAQIKEMKQICASMKVSSGEQKGFEKVNDSINRLDKKIAKLSEKINQKNISSMEQIKSDNQIEELRAKETQSENEIADLKKQINILQTKYTGKKEELGSARDALNLAKTKSDNNAKEMEELTAKLEKAKASENEVVFIPNQSTDKKHSGQLEKKLEELEKKVENLEQNKQELTTQINVLTKELNSSKNSVVDKNKLEKEKAKLENQNVESEEKISDLNKQIADLQINYESLYTKNTEKGEELKGYKNNLDLAKSDLENVAKEKINLQDEQKKLNASSKNHTEELENRLDGFRVKVDELEHNKEELMTEIKELTKELNNSKTESKKNSEALVQAQKELTDAKIEGKTALEDLQSKYSPEIASASKKLLEAQNEINQLRAQSSEEIEVNVAKLKQMEAEVKELTVIKQQLLSKAPEQEKKSIEQLNFVVERLNYCLESIKSKEATIADLENKIEESKETAIQLKEAKSSLKEVQAELVGNKTKIDELQETIEGLQKAMPSDESEKVKDLDGKVETLEQEKTKLQKTIENLTKHLETSVAKNGKKDPQVAILEKQLKDTQTQMSILQLAQDKEIRNLESLKSEFRKLKTTNKEMVEGQENKRSAKDAPINEMKRLDEKADSLLEKIQKLEKRKEELPGDIRGGGTKNARKLLREELVETTSQLETLNADVDNILLEIADKKDASFEQKMKKLESKKDSGSIELLRRMKEAKIESRNKDAAILNEKSINANYTDENVSLKQQLEELNRKLVNAEDTLAQTKEELGVELGQAKAALGEGSNVVIIEYDRAAGIKKGLETLSKDKKVSARTDKVFNANLESNLKVAGAKIEQSKALDAARNQAKALGVHLREAFSLASINYWAELDNAQIKKLVKDKNFVLEDFNGIHKILDNAKNVVILIKDALGNYIENEEYANFDALREQLKAVESFSNQLSDIRPNKIKAKEGFEIPNAEISKQDYEKKAEKNVKITGQIGESLRIGIARQISDLIDAVFEGEVKGTFSFITGNYSDELRGIQEGLNSSVKELTTDQLAKAESDIQRLVIEEYARRKEPIPDAIAKRFNAITTDVNKIYEIEKKSNQNPAIFLKERENVQERKQEKRKEKVGSELKKIIDESLNSSGDSELEKFQEKLKNANNLNREEIKALYREAGVLLAGNHGMSKEIEERYEKVGSTLSKIK
ncbi:MAG TPA: hypothetical protein VGP47_07835 [Parachlamydiaceae bacterium]|nr:hypothetical protein [Nitrosopumilus sp.]HEV8052389.1 hypothetical protein [Parachlamydiaceae bacterium]